MISCWVAQQERQVCPFHACPGKTRALTQAESKGWITRDTAAKFFAYMAESTGFNINAEAELAKAKTESEQQQEANEADYVE